MKLRDEKYLTKVVAKEAVPVNICTYISICSNTGLFPFQQRRMSLFKARDWWSTALGEKDEFDQGCLCVADVDNSGSGQGKFRITDVDF